MPNWAQIVRKKLRVVAICPMELTEELAAHLEDSYEALLAEGLTREQAFQQALGQIEGCCRLRLVRRFLQEDVMTGFIPKVVLPGLLTAGVARFYYLVLASCHLSSQVIWLGGGELPTWWWYMLPIWGALGALLSERNGGSRVRRMTASLFPSAILCTLVLILFVTGFTISGFANHYQLASARMESLGIVPPAFGVIPAVLSLLGAGISEVSSKKFCRFA